MILGLAILGASFPVDLNGRVVPLWQDMMAAAVAVFAFSGFFRMPLRMLGWPVAIGMLAHALRWAAIVVLGMRGRGCRLRSVLRRRGDSYASFTSMPHAICGDRLASVVSLMLGVYILRVVGGLVQIAGASPTTPALLSAIIGNGVTALMVILAMSLGLTVPKMLIESSDKKRQRIKSPETKELADVR